VKPGVKSQKSRVKSRKSKVRSQKSEVLIIDFLTFDFRLFV
jgi:hypothetical protein